MQMMKMEHKEAKLRVLGKLFRYTVEFFQDKGFPQLMPVMLGKSVDPLGPDPGSSIVSIPEVSYQGEVLRLVTSLILHKQVAVKELSKVFIMSPCIRLERPERGSTGRHLFEFTQADFEIKDARTDDVLGLLEEYYAGLGKYMSTQARDEFGHLGLDAFEFKPPFKRYALSELISRYGPDWEVHASLDHRQPFWVTDLKREFYEKERDGHYVNYDLIYPMGFGEGISGGEREFEHGRLHERIVRDKIDIKPYESYLDIAKQGLVASAGAGIGMERLARFLTRSDHVSDVTMFKRVPGEKVLI